jgi:hypothetical protein
MRFRRVVGAALAVGIIADDAFDPATMPVSRWPTTPR